MSFYLNSKTLHAVYFIGFKSQRYPDPTNFTLIFLEVDKDDEYITKINNLMNNPPIPGTESSNETSTNPVPGDNPLPGLPRGARPGGRIDLQSLQNILGNLGGRPPASAHAPPSSIPPSAIPPSSSSVSRSTNPTSVGSTPSAPSVSLSQIVTPDNVSPLLNDPRVRVRKKKKNFFACKKTL